MCVYERMYAVYAWLDVTPRVNTFCLKTSMECHLLPMEGGDDFLMSLSPLFLAQGHHREKTSLYCKCSENVESNVFPLAKLYNHPAEKNSFFEPPKGDQKDYFSSSIFAVYVSNQE